jgi:hypothetical protein
VKPVSFLVVAVLVVASFAASARGEVTCPLPPGASADLGRVAPGERLAWIDTHLSSTARRARQWTWGWGVGLVVSTGLNFVPLAFVPRDQRIDWYTGAATTIVGIVPLVIAPLDVVTDARELHRELDDAHVRPEDPGAVCRLLADAEARLGRDAANQRDGQRWWLHVGNVALNTGVGLFLGFGYHHWGAGAFNAVFGSLIGEAIILTQPTASIDDLRAYREGAMTHGPTTLGYRASF